MWEQQWPALAPLHQTQAGSSDRYCPAHGVRPAIATVFQSSTIQRSRPHRACEIAAWRRLRGDAGAAAMAMDIDRNRVAQDGEHRRRGLGGLRRLGRAARSHLSGEHRPDRDQRRAPHPGLGCRDVAVACLADVPDWPVLHRSGEGALAMVRTWPWPQQSMGSSPAIARASLYFAAIAVCSPAISRSTMRRMCIRLASEAMSTRPCSPSSSRRRCCASTISLSSRNVGAISR